MRLPSEDSSAGPSAAATPNLTQRRPTGPASVATSGAGASSFYGRGDMESVAAKLKDPTGDIKNKIHLAMELRETVDLFSRDMEFSSHLDVIISAAVDILTKTKPSFINTAWDYKFRYLLLDILSRIPMHEIMRPYALDVMNLLLNLIRHDNAESVTICLKLAVDLYRSFKFILEPTAIPFFNLIVEMYDIMPQTCEEIFGDIKVDPTQPDGYSPLSSEPLTPKPVIGIEATRASLMRRTASSASSAPGAPGFAASDQNPTNMADAMPAMKSFKNLAECPVAVVFLLQSYKMIADTLLATTLPTFFKALKVSPAPQVQWHQVYSERGQGPFVGIAPVIIKAGKRSQFNEFVIAQVKITSFIAYVLKAQASVVKPYGPDFPPIFLRMLKEIPPESSSCRRELLIAARHFLSTDLRAHFLPFFGDLINIRILVGTGLTSHEYLRHLAYTTVAEIVQLTKADLKPAQIEATLVEFMNILHDPTNTSNVHAISARVILVLVELVGPGRFEPQEAVRVYRWVSEQFVRKIEALAEVRTSHLALLHQRRHQIVQQRAKDLNTKATENSTSDKNLHVSEPKEDQQTSPKPVEKEKRLIDQVAIEKAKLLGSMTYLVDPPDLSKENCRRNVARCCVASFNMMICNLKKLDAPLPDASILGRLLIGGVRCFSIYEYRRELKEIKDIVDSYLFIFTQIDLVLFTEVVEPNIDAIVHECRINNEMMAFPQLFISNQVLTKTFLGITLRYLMNHLSELGKDKNPGLMVKLFKMCFQAIGMYQENEVIIQPHLKDLIMELLRLAPQASEPGQYYTVLRALFRAISGGRFEILYKEVTPLLAVLLEELNKRFDAATDPKERDILAELCLTVPVRLSVLLPYITYLMRPMVLALQAVPDLISQGLRTLELCLNNLTQEFLNPLMEPVIHEVMVALWKLLKPHPFHTGHAPSAMRILGKLGGRNRKVLGPTQIQWKPIVGQECYLPVKLSGQERSITLPPIIDLAGRMMKRNDLHYRQNGFELLKYITPVFLSIGYGAGEGQDTFTSLLKGLFDATRVPDLAEEAKQHLGDLFEHILVTEIWQEPVAYSDRIKYPLTLTNLVVDALLDNLTIATEKQHLTAASQFTSRVFKRIFEKAKDNPPPREEVMMLAKRTLCSKAASCCYNHSWARKLAGHEVISHLVGELDMGFNWIFEHQVEMARALLFLHKDAPSPAEKYLQGPTATHLKLLKMCNVKSDNDAKPDAQTKLDYLVGLFVIELCSQVSGVRQLAQSSLQLISEQKGRPVYDLLKSQRERLVPIFNKPLRALAFPMQIGHMDALAFCVRLEPPLFGFNDQMVRMLQEAVGIADADDVALIGRTNQAKTAKALIELRVVCLQFLAATLKLPEMKDHPATKAKILSIYFQSLYAKTPEVVNAAHASLKELLQHGGSRLPKDLLQNGLRPVLNNLSDHKKLTLPSLQGLARLVELLTTYFKVEIGSKLLEHFKQFDHNTLAAGALASTQDSGTLQIMAGVINIFHLLGNPAAGIYLAELISNVVHVETILKKVTASPFTKPLALYVNLYPEPAARYFFQYLEDERFVSTFKWIILSDYAPNFRSHLRATALEWLQQSFARPSPCGLHGSIVLQQLTVKDPDFTANSDDVIHLISQRWVSEVRKSKLSGSITEARAYQIKEDAISLEIMMSCVKLKPMSTIDLLFHMADVLGGDRSVEYCYITRFYYEHVLVSSDVTYKRTILDRFLIVINNGDVTTGQKTAILRHLINPLLLVAFARGTQEAAVVDAEYISAVHHVIWSAFIPNTTAKVFVSDDKLDVEMIYMTSLILEYRYHLIHDQRKDIIKFGWSHLNAKVDPMVTNAAYILIARFIDAFESPTKLVNQILLALLRLHSGDGKNLVYKALDIIIPALPKRFKDNPTEWVRSIRRTLIEEGQNMPFLCNFYLAVVRKPEPFYAHREMFIPQFVATLPKLVVSSNSNAETRALAVDLIEVIVRWEQQRAESGAMKDEDTRMSDGASTSRAAASVTLDSERDRPSSAKRMRLDRSGSVALSVAGSDQVAGTYVVPNAIREAIVSIGMRIVSTATEPASKSAPVARSLSLIGLILTEVWHDVDVKLVFLQRILTAEISDTNLGSFCNTAEILNIVVTNKSDEWLLTNLTVMQSLVDRGLTALQYSDVVKIQRSLINRLFHVLPATKKDGEGTEVQTERNDKQGKIDNDVANFEQWATRIIKEGLKETHVDPHYGSALVLLEAWDQANPSKVDVFIPDIVRVFQRAVRDHLVAAQAEGSNQTVEQTRHLLERLCDLMKNRLASMTDQRRWVLTGLVKLIEKSPSIGLCRYILQLQRRWVESKEPLPSIKEKTAMLLKTMSYDSKGDEDLLAEYLQLILDIYLAPSFSRSEYTVRLEPAFLLGCRSRDADTRTKFMEVFDNSIRREPFHRLHYLIGVQNWEPLAEVNWMHHATDLLLGVVDMAQPVLIDGRLPLPTGTTSRFAQWAEGVTIKNVLKAARLILYADPSVTEKIWVSLFQATWSTFSKRDQADISRYLVPLLSKDFLIRSVERRPNRVQILLAGVRACSPTVILPPHLVRYLGKTYAAWHCAIEHLQEMFEEIVDDEANRETVSDALAQLYAELGETDLFYGQWRRKALCVETNAAMSYEQIGEWGAAQQAYEVAQERARSNLLTFGKGEYSLWEDHWVLCAQKMQQWDFLSDLARAEQNSELLLECQWRQSDWTVDHGNIQLALEASPTQSIRKITFEAYLTLLKHHIGVLPEESKADFTRICDQGIQLALHQWYQLPEIVTEAHVPLLQSFQQFVELQEAAQILTSLRSTTAQNLDVRSLDMKRVLMAWRERLPNPWEDINIWSDLVAWRQHIFTAINQAYLPLVQSANQGQGANAASFAYRGFHETAWIINQFAHVARKHRLHAVCIASLTKIYTLPNIEIQEAFLKLREQAKCHYQNPAEWAQGLEVLSSTNLMYFQPNQKAEFHTLKAMFLGCLDLHEEAQKVFNQAIGSEFQFGKSWAEWGAYQDRLFASQPQSLHLAAGAVSCYLQASGLYRNGKVRRLLIRILWLLAFDDASGTIGKAFESFKGDIPIWHWAYFIPQLLTSLSAPREARYAKALLMRITKTFPQSVYYYLRAANDDLSATRPRALSAVQRAAMSASPGMTPEITQVPQTPVEGQSQQTPGTSNPIYPSTGIRSATMVQHVPAAYEHVDEIIAVLKTQFPLLALSMEMLIDQIYTRFKPTPEEEIHRLLTALLQEALSMFVERASNPNDDLHLPEATKANLAKFSENLTKMPLQPLFHREFIECKMTLPRYVHKLQEWRNKYEATIERKARKPSLESVSHWMVEFQYQKFDDIEIPGQYLKRLGDDNNSHFIKIARFETTYSVQRHKDLWYRRVTLVGHDASKHNFMIQMPLPRESRREERIIQCIRLLNCPLMRKQQSRSRDVTFTVPVVVPFSANIRIIETDPALCSLQEIYEAHCTQAGFVRDDPIVAYAERMRSLACDGVEGVDSILTKLEIADEISAKLIPDSLLKHFMSRTMKTAGDLWYFRKRTAIQYASFIFLTYIFSMSERTPNRIYFNRSSGQVQTTHMYPTLLDDRAEFGHKERVPFRFTPNIQTFLTRPNIEGLLTGSILAIAQALTEHEHEMDLPYRLSIFVRDEIVAWMATRQTKLAFDDPKMLETVLKNLDGVVKRARVLACEMEMKTIDPENPQPVCQTVTELINQSTNLPELYSMHPAWMPWL